MTPSRTAPWILFKETGELVCQRCGECSYPIGKTFVEIKIAGERFTTRHVACKAKSGAAKVLP